MSIRDMMDPIQWYEYQAWRISLGQEPEKNDYQIKDKSINARAFDIYVDYCIKRVQKYMKELKDGK